MLNYYTIPIKFKYIIHMVLNIVRNKTEAVRKRDKCNK